VTESLRINDRDYVVDAGPMTPLATVLREQLGLTGTKVACSEGFCGSCLVRVAGEPVASCLLPVGLVGNRPIQTIEAVAPDAGHLTPVQQALKDHDVVQCGMCFPGMIMTLSDLLQRRPDADAGAIRRELTGNLCRCTGYELIIGAALAAGSKAGADA
jgi:aerobic carbon-monoxide dehydrogenase small subunit